jgi:hypothetical protein
MKKSGRLVAFASVFGILGIVFFVGAVARSGTSAGKLIFAGIGVAMWIVSAGLVASAWSRWKTL